MEIKYSVKTDVGRKRDHNEDSFGFCPEERLFFVCDGMGGHAAGDFASQKAVETIKSLMNNKDDPQLSGIIKKGPISISESGRKIVNMVLMAHRRLFNLAVLYPKLRGMGTTFTSVLFHDGLVNIVNVGDSRVYRLRDSKFEQLSVDHSWMEELIQDGEIKASEIDSFSKKNVITRALGTNPEVQVDWKACKAEKGDIYLLCSDGLSGELNDEQIAGILKNNRENMEKASDELIKQANEAGGSDNITVILAEVEGESQEVPENVKLGEIMTVSPSKDEIEVADSYLIKNFTSEKTAVPKGVEREKKKLHESTLFRAIAAAIILLSVIIIIKQPWSKSITGSNAVARKGDVVIKTTPPGATVSIFSGTSLLERKISPADFLALNEGFYRIEIEKDGYDKKRFTVQASKGKQETKTIELDALTMMELSLGIDPGFDLSAEIYLDGELLEYYGTPLTVQRVGVVGKKVSISKDTEHTVRIEEIEETFSIGPADKSVQVKIESRMINIGNGAEE